MYNTILLVNCALSFYLISSQREFLIIKNSGVREEHSYLTFYLQIQLQQITVEENIFGEFALVHQPATILSAVRRWKIIPINTERSLANTVATAVNQN